MEVPYRSPVTPGTPSPSQRAARTSDDPASFPYPPYEAAIAPGQNAGGIFYPRHPAA